jgi:hypothetical protein
MYLQHYNCSILGRDKLEGIKVEGIKLEGIKLEGISLKRLMGCKKGDL